MNSDKIEKTENKDGIEQKKCVVTATLPALNIEDAADEEKFDINAQKEELLKKVQALKLQNVEDTFSEADVKSAAFPESLKIEEERERIRFERKSKLRAYARTATLLNEALACEHKRISQEKQLAQVEAKLDKERDTLAVQFELDKAAVQQKIDNLKAKMFEFGKSIQEKEIAESSGLVDKSNKEQWFGFILKNKKKLPAEKNETLTQMVEEMQGYNAEIESLQLSFNQKVAQNLAKFEEAKDKVIKAKQEENFKKRVAMAWVAGQEEKKQPIHEAVKEGVQEIVSLEQPKKETKRSYTQRIVQALRQIYYYLCKKLTGKKREQARTTGKSAITKVIEKDQTLDVMVNGQSARPTDRRATF